MITATCVQCGKKFEARRATARFCSDACRKAWAREHTEGDPPSSIIDEPQPIEKTDIDLVEETVDIPDVPQSVRERIAILREEMNKRNRGKGLPLAVPPGYKDSFVATGIEAIDNLTKKLDANDKGGFPCGKITEVFGFKGSGKSSLVKQICDNRPDLNILFLDAEGGFNSSPENVVVVKGNVIEDVMPIMIDAAKQQTYDLIILDSVASLVTQKEFDGEAEGLASVARAFGPQVKRLLAHLQPLKDGLPDPGATAAIFINQFRDTTKSFGKVRYTPGGRALEYYASLRLEFASFISKDKIIRGGKIAGQKINVRVEKTRYGVAEDFSFPLMYDTLESFDEYYMKRLKELGIR